MAGMFVHPTAEVSPMASIGSGTKIWHHCHIREGAQIGNDCILAQGVYVDQGVKIGNRVKIQNYVSVYHGVQIEDGVFVGPHVCFTNDLRPRAVNPDGTLKAAEDWTLSQTLVREGAALGANATIVAGVTIGRWAMIGAGSVVTRPVPDYGLARGNPAQLVGYVCPCGQTLIETSKGAYRCPYCDREIQLRDTHMIPISKPFIGEAEKQAVLAVLESGILVQGSRTIEFEERFADLCDVRHAIATSSGTAALHVALLAHNVGPGDEVITSAFTFIATVNTILFTGARPVFVDIESETFNLNPALVARAVTPRTKVIMPVHLYGYPCDMVPLQQIAAKHGLVIIEDAAQAVGAKYQERPVGSFGTGCFSLYATKNLMSGEGGMITTSDDAIADRARLIRNHGMRQRYHHELVGHNFRLSDLHAAIGLTQIGRLPKFTAKRRENAMFYNANLKTVITPKVREGYEHVWHQYTIRVREGTNRDQAVEQLKTAGIGTGIFYPIPAHKHQYIEECIGALSLPITEQLAKEVISLPVHPQLTWADREQIVEEVNKL